MPEDTITAAAVTFLFTDVEGSTRLLQSVGAGTYGRILLDHDRILQEAVASGGGHIVDTQGDAVFAAFPDARRAVDAAVAAQRAISAHAWPGGVGVRVRSGLHVGTPDVQEGRYLGLDVHLAARVAATAHGGQIVVSEGLRDALGDVPELRFVDIGAHHLKDFDQALRLYQVAAAGLEEGFPPPRTGEPAPLAFAGREGELAGAAAEAIARAARRRERRRLFAIAAALAVPVVVAGAIIATRPHPVRISPDSVAVIDAGSGNPVADIPVHAAPAQLAVSRDTVWVLNQSAQTLSRIRVDTDRPVTTALTEPASGIAVTGAGQVWVVDGQERRITVLDGRAAPLNQFRLTTPKGIFDVGTTNVAASGDDVWISSTGGLSEYRPGHHVRVRIDLPQGSIAATQTAAWLGGGFGFFGSAGDLTRIDARTGHVRRVPTGEADLVTVGDGSVWVANSSNGILTRVDPATSTVVGHSQVGSGIDALAAGDGSVWVALADGTLARVDAGSGDVVGRTHLVGRPTAIALAHRRVWVALQRVPRSGSGGGLRVTTVTGAIDSLDPAFAFQALSWQILYATGLNLLEYPDARAPVGLKLVPQAATARPRITNHGHTYTFAIRRGYRFSPPSNRPVTAESFRYAIEREIRVQDTSPASFLVADIKGARAYAAERTRHVSGVRVQGDRLKITTTDVAPDLLARLALPTFSAVPPSAPLRTNGSSRIASAGPYYIRSYSSGQLVLASNPNYPGPRTSRYATITYRFAPDASWRAVAGGRADYDPGLAPPPEAVASRYGPSSRARQRLFVNPVPPQVYYFVLNTHRSIFRSRFAREAVNYAIDRRELAATVSPGSVPTDQYLPPNIPGYPGSGRAYPIGAPDLARARRLMRHSGLTLPVRAILNTCTDEPGCARRAALLTRELRPLGIDVVTHTFRRGVEFAKDLTDRGFDIADEGTVYVYADPGFLLGNPFPPYLDLGPYEDAFARAADTFPPRRYAEYGRLDLALARGYAPLAAFAIPGNTDFFSARVGCQVYQPVFGMDLTRLCRISRSGRS